MALFKGLVKKRVSADGQTPTAESSTDDQGDKPDKGSPVGWDHKDHVRHTVDETVPEAAMDQVRSNKAFLLPDGTGVVIAMATRREPVNGLGPVSAKNDEAKGTILERIRSGAIDVIVNKEMLVNEMIGIIPTQATLSNDGMMEFGLLKRVDYVWATVDWENDDELGIHPVKKDGTAVMTGLSDVIDVANGTRSLAEALPDLWAEHGGDKSTAQDTAADAPEQMVPTVGGFLSGVDAQADENGPEETDSESSYEGDGGEPEPWDDIDEGDSETEFGSDLPVQDGTDEDPESVFGPIDQQVPTSTDVVNTPDTAGQDLEQVDDGRVYTAVDVRDAVARRFLSEELGLEVDMTLFDRVFADDSEAMVFSADGMEASQWLSESFAPMMVSANADLRQMRQDHLASLRQMYVDMVSRAAHDVLEQVSVSPDSGTSWAQTMAELDEARDKMMEGQQETVAKERDRLTKEFTTRRDEYADAARSEAAARYTERHSRAHELALADTESRIATRFAEIDDAARDRILQIRRREAVGAFETSVTKIMAVLAERNREYVDKERELRDEWSQEFRVFVHDNLKDDIAHSQVLAEEHERQHVADQIRKEAESKEAELKKAYHEAETRHLDEVEKLHREAALALERHREEAAERLRIAQERADTLAQQNSDLFKRVEQERSAHQVQLESMKNNNYSLQTALQLESASTKKANRLFVALAILVSVAALAAGFLSGYVTRDLRGVKGATWTPVAEVVTSDG